MPSRNAYFAPTATLASHVTEAGSQEPQATTCAVPLVYQDAGSPAGAALRGAAVDIGDLVAEFETHSPESRRALHQGRQWVAHTFYGDDPISLARLRLNKGWSQAELAQRAATSQSYVARLERGRIDPQISTARKIAHALGIPLEVLTQALDQDGKK